MVVPQALDELYDRHAPVLYGLVLGLAGRDSAEGAFQDACNELWNTPQKRMLPCTAMHLARVAISVSRRYATATETTPAFEVRLAVLMEAMRTRAGNEQVLLVTNDGLEPVLDLLLPTLPTVLPA